MKSIKLLGNYVGEDPTEALEKLEAANSKGYGTALASNHIELWEAIEDSTITVHDLLAMIETDVPDFPKPTK